MNFWKTAYVNLLKKSYNSVRLMYQKNSQPFYLQLPKNLEKTDDIIKFGDKINSHIAFAEIHIINQRH